jgi:hypothetical protein
MAQRYNNEAPACVLFFLDFQSRGFSYRYLPGAGQVNASAKNWAIFSSVYMAEFRFSIFHFLVRKLENRESAPLVRRACYT